MFSDFDISKASRHLERTAFSVRIGHPERKLAEVPGQSYPRTQRNWRRFRSLALGLGKKEIVKHRKDLGSG